MEAKARSFTFLSNEGRVTIPFFQRGYVWDEDNWNDLLTDLRNAGRSHFLGSLILKQQKLISGEPKEVMVIDGQQRLTTLSVLVKALYDTFSGEIRGNCAVEIRTYLFFKQHSTDKGFLVRIQHSHVDADAYTSVITAGLDGPAIDTSVSPRTEENRILKCYRYFVGELRKLSEDNRTSLFNRILSPEHKLLVVIDLDEVDDEQTIFDTTNTAGVRLTCADIIKNGLFQVALRLFVDKPKQALNLYKKTWEKVFLVDDETIAFWEAKRPTGRLMRDNIEILLHSIAVIKEFYDPDKHTLADLSVLYKTQVSSFQTIEPLNTFIEEIQAYGDIYRAEIPSFDDSTLFSFGNSAQRLFHILDAFQITTLHPFILFVLKNHAKDEDMRDRMLVKLEKFVMRRVISKQETNSFNKLCRVFIAHPNALKTAIEQTSDDEVVAGLKAITNKNAALVLFWLELHRRYSDHKYDVRELKDDFSLEHIMPQKWEDHWRDMPDKRNADGTSMNPEEAKKDRYEKIYWLGNMTLLTSSLNSALKNYSFGKKMNGEGRKKGIKAYASLSITKDDIVHGFEAGDTDWGEDKIKARTVKLSGEFLEIWGTKENVVQ